MTPEEQVEMQEPFLLTFLAETERQEERNE